MPLSSKAAAMPTFLITLNVATTIAAVNAESWFANRKMIFK